MFRSIPNCAVSVMSLVLTLENAVKLQMKIKQWNVGGTWAPIHTVCQIRNIKCYISELQYHGKAGKMFITI